MRVVIAGAGNVGTFIANELVDGGHEVLLIENDAEVVDAHRAARPASTVRASADACEVDDRSRKPAWTAADVVVAATGDDEDNLVMSLLAKQEFARAPRDRPGEPPQEPVAVQRDAGASTSRCRRRTSSPRWSRRRCRSAASCACSSSRAARSGLVEVTLAEDCPGRRHARSRDIDIPRDATIVAVVRDDHVVMPRGDTVLAAGDEVLAIVTTESEDHVRAVLTGA